MSRQTAVNPAGSGGAQAAPGRRDDAANLSGRLEARLQDLQSEQGDTVPLGEVGALVVDLLTTLDGDITSADIELQNELRDLADYIRRAHKELEALEVGDLRQRQIPEAADQLDAVVQATEEATGVFLDAAEEVQSIARDISGPHGDRLTTIGNRIFEASNFQDITGQRITKVVSTLRHIEAKILNLTQTFGLNDDETDRERKAKGDVAADSDYTDADLLNGPQMPDKANTQDDIDAFFD